MTLPRMDSRIGLDYIVENREYVSKLGAALDTNNTIVKKQVFELLSALCAYNSEGYSRAIETLEHYKNLKNERYRFKLVVNELEKATNVEYQVALLAFINCVIISASSLQDRLRIRNEFIGLKVLPILNNLRRVAHSVGDIIVQLDVFDEQRECDEAQSLQGSNGINLNSHLDVFYAILRQVADTPQEIPFLSILQHLLRIDPKEPISDIIWDTAEKLVHRATLLENHEDSARLLRAPSVQKFTCPHCRGEATSPSRKQSIIPTTPNSVHSQTNLPSIPTPLMTSSSSPSVPGLNSPLSNHNIMITSIPAPPQPPPPPPPPMAPPPPPPPNLMAMNIPNCPPAPPPPAPNLLSVNCVDSSKIRPKTPDQLLGGMMNESLKLLPQQETPAPKSKMKTINWNKIPPNKVIGKKNIWTIVADTHQDSPMADLDWNEMEGLFCLQSTSSQGSPKLGRENGNCDTVDRKTKKENSEITLLDGKRSLNVNIFLKQFRSSNEDIIQLIRDGEHDDIGAEKLRGLLKILPEVDELDMLRSFDGDKSRLGNAEKFLLQLLEVPNYKLRIESMLLKEEFAANVSYLEPCINAMLYAGDDLMNNKMLQEVLYMVVVAGNFLNSGGYAGNAAGVKLSSLQKLTDIRANKPGMNLIHFVALQAEKRNPDLLTFPIQMTTLENASKTTAEQINNEISTLDNRIKKIKKQIEQVTTEIDIKDQMMEFLINAEREVSLLQRGMKEVELMRIKLSEFFCEDRNTFKMEECFKIFQNFCEKFKQAVKENDRRRVQEEQATLRRKQREEQLARRAKQLSQCGTPVSDPENGFLLDPSQFYDIRYSPAMSRRRLGSFNTGSADGPNSLGAREGEGPSPDVTPNGSLRRRRSRILPGEEDDSSLMEFLRSSGHDNSSRERKTSSYGSLDRSWARRARTGTSSKKRPDLLSIDFGADRERPSSPSPVIENKSITTVAETTEETKPRISREWRQKIESWLQANENDDKQNDDYRRRRRLVNNNRRSLENEAESEKSKLDPLPEEKVTVNTNGKETYKRVYPDWKPSSTLENTDVVGTIEAIEDVQTKDKSPWRKSNLNTSNNREETGKPQDVQKARRSSSLSGSPTLHSIDEESDKRKNVIQKLSDRSVCDKLHIYIRRPSDTEENNTSSSTTTGKSSTRYSNPQVITATIDNKYCTGISNHNLESLSSNNNNNINNSSNISQNSNKNESNRSSNNKIIDKNSAERYSKIEIDSDNIETPPVTRRILSSPISKSKSQSNSCKTTNSDGISNSSRFSTTTDYKSQNPNDIMDEVENSIGHFDRFSSARRTRRYKRPTDHSSGNEDTSPNGESMSNHNNSVDTPKKSGSSYIIKDNKKDDKQEKTIEKDNRESEKEERLKRWQEKLKNLSTTIDSQNETKVNLNSLKTSASKLEKVGRHISSINQEDVREAIRNLKSPTGTPERIWSPPRDILSKEKPSIIKTSNHELNDEGFEETQSLVSDTPSHGKESTTSSCNEPASDDRTSSGGRGRAEGDGTGKRARAMRMTSTDSAATTTSSDTPNKSQTTRLVSTGRSSSSTTTVSPSKSQIQNLFERNKKRSSLERSRSMRLPPSAQQTHNFPSSLSTQHSPSMISSRRASSLRKSDTSSSITSSPGNKRDVERSSSRTSLRSSRSSLNSAVSTNTVVRKIMPSSAKSTTSSSGAGRSITTSILRSSSGESSPNKRPLATQNSSLSINSRNNNSSSVNRIPASRSSSSGSSIGPGSSRKPPAKVSSSSSIAGSTSFKENQHNSSNKTTIRNSIISNKSNASSNVSSGSSAGSFSNLYSHSSSRSTKGIGATNSHSGGSINASSNTRLSPSSRISGFMRPTASSVTKRQNSDGKSHK